MNSFLLPLLGTAGAAADAPTRRLRTPATRLVPFRQGTRWGYADHRRRLVLPARYDEAGPFVDEAGLGAPGQALRLH